VMWPPQTQRRQGQAGGKCWRHLSLRSATAVECDREMNAIKSGESNDDVKKCAKAS